MASGKRSDLFIKLQQDYNVGGGTGRSLKLVLEGGVRWNASYSMIERALLLRESLDAYAAKLRVSEEALDLETYNEDYISPLEWKVLGVIRDQLQPLFWATKSLEGNTDLSEGNAKPSHGALWEVLPVFEHVLQHFEDLENDAKDGKFNNHPGIQQSITLAWEKTQEYYRKTDASVAWQAAVVLHPRFKWKYFEDHWTGNEARFVREGKTKLKKLWEQQYKSEPTTRQPSPSPEPSKEKDWMEEVLESVAPVSRPKRATGGRRDQLFVLKIITGWWKQG